MAHSNRYKNVFSVNHNIWHHCLNLPADACACASIFSMQKKLPIAITSESESTSLCPVSHHNDDIWIITHYQSRFAFQGSYGIYTSLIRKNHEKLNARRSLQNNNEYNQQVDNHENFRRPLNNQWKYNTTFNKYNNGSDVFETQTENQLWESGHDV